MVNLTLRFLIERKMMTTEQVTDTDVAVKRATKLSAEKQLAEKIHTLLCPVTYEQFCSWDWEYKIEFTGVSKFPTKLGEHDWTQPGHKHYLKLAKKLIATGVSETQILTIISLTLD